MAVSNHRKIRIVCVEDDRDMIDLIRLIVTRRGYELVGWATGGLEGIDVIRREKPDVVLLDLMMPDIDGWEVYQQMKADPELRNIPVIVVTARAQDIDRLLGLYIARVDDYLTKPFGPSELIDSIERVVSRSAVNLSDPEQHQ
ncbi:MAG: response regulator [Anaerolineae bacterium]|nr:response regulator [Thermoflexus sp.]MDW8065144.1 response regulator [Anaerolineae bacterium]